MIEIILFFFITAFCELRISYPPELYNLYPNNIVPSVTANLRRFPTYTQGSVGFLPNDTNPCVRSSWPQFANYTVFAIMDITCHYSTVVHIAEERKAQGVIFVLNLTSSRLKEVLISPGSQTTIFVAGISNEYIDMWRKFEQGVILVELDRDRIYSEKPRISISLTGSFIHDADFIKEWYFYLFPIYKSDVDIDLSFNYSFSCSDCSPNDCYSNNKYCMIDDINHFSGRNMIDRTLMEIALLDYIKNHDIFLGAFAIFLYELGKSCEYDYSKKCSGNVLNWLKVDLEEIQNRIDKSWISNMNEVRADNYILRSQYNKWISKSYFEPIPSISIGNITLCLNQGYGLQTYICNYISYTSYVCDDTCNKNCTIGDLSDGYCDQNCETDSCFNDIQDCNSLLHFCDDIHNRVCKYISDGGDEGLDTGSIIAISIFSSIGFCFW
ncbi:unnamed protein product [Blepharisma stoltei]|uniref:Uncharacterized protein n=1 Tax=Blepharisma stoltei TaxID=1481888 RepID=A0AAU9JGR0_9CILI|nr:unnamed protein product [Blepharisma stoltei]